MTPRLVAVFFIAPVVFVSVISNIVVVGFMVSHVQSPLRTGSSTIRTLSTTLRYASESHYIDVKDDQQLIYVPLQEMETTIENVQEEHQLDRQNMKNIINEQRRELKILQEKMMINVLKEKMRYDHLSTDSIINWGENHNEKTKRTAGRMRYLTNENERLQTELNLERKQLEHERGHFQRKLEESRDETTEAEQLLSLERSYFETATKLLEARLERESKNVKFLEDQLIESKRTATVEHHYPFSPSSSSSSVDNDEPPSIETWAEWTDANNNDQDYYHAPSQHHHYHEEVAPQVRSPQQAATHQQQQEQQYSHDNWDYSHHDGETYFHQEIPHQQNYYPHRRTVTHQSSHARSTFTTPFTTTRPEMPITTTIMEMSS